MQNPNSSLTLSNIHLCRDDERAAILAIINAAAEAYRGVIPPDCWHDPYMAETSSRARLRRA